jgi:long-chain fatty acid transport protein
MIMKKFLISSVVSLFFLIIYPQFLYAGGPVHGAKAAGMGSAFAGVADDPSAILFNPGGLSQVKGTNIYGGVAFLFPLTEFESLSGGKEETEFQIFFPPHLYISSDYNMKDLVFGLGIYSPFGIGGRKWPETGPMKYLSIECFTSTLSVNPTVAWQMTSTLSMGFGINYMVAWSEQSLFLPDNSKLKIKALGEGWGYNLGALVRLSESVRIGLAYRSGIKVELDGDFDVSGTHEFHTGLNTVSRFPEVYTLGLAYFPNDRLVLDFDVEWVRYSSFDTSYFDLEDESFMPDTSVALDWADSLQLKAGMQYKINETVFLRAGYAYAKTPVPEYTLTPANPDSDQHNFSLGLGILRNKWTVDFFYNAGVFEDRKVNNTILSGEYKNIIHYIGYSVGYRF